MLRLDSDKPVEFCDGLRRRDFLHAGALSLLGLGLNDLFAMKALFLFHDHLAEPRSALRSLQRIIPLLIQARPVITIDFHFSSPRLIKNDESLQLEGRIRSLHQPQLQPDKGYRNRHCHPLVKQVLPFDPVSGNFPG